MNDKEINFKHRKKEKGHRWALISKHGGGFLGGSNVRLFDTRQKAREYMTIVSGFGRVPNFRPVKVRVMVEEV